MHREEDINIMRDVLIYFSGIKTMISRDQTTLKDKSLFEPLLNDF
jgi:hypothetical protein